MAIGNCQRTAPRKKTKQEKDRSLLSSQPRIRVVLEATSGTEIQPNPICLFHDTAQKLNHHWRLFSERSCYCFPSTTSSPPTLPASQNPGKQDSALASWKIATCRSRSTTIEAGPSPPSWGSPGFDSKSLCWRYIPLANGLYLYLSPNTNMLFFLCLNSD